jgi:hypothetical protein
MQNVSFEGPEGFSDMGECKKDLWVAGKMSWYQQRDCQSLLMEFSDGKLKQKGFFHSVRDASSRLKKNCITNMRAKISFAMFCIILFPFSLAK